MAQYTITIPDNINSGITAARAAYNAALPAPAGNPDGTPVGFIVDDAAYVQYVMEGAANSYARQYVYQAPANAVAPVLDKTTAIVGTVVTCAPGTWIGSPVPTYSYQWFRSGVVIRNGINAAWTAVAADVGKTLTCIVKATNPAGSPTGVLTSNACVVS